MPSLAKLSSRLLAGLCLLSSPVCHSYDHYHWQAGFPTPLAGPGADLVTEQTRFLLQQRSHLQQRLIESQPMIRWVTEQVQARKLPPMLALLPLIESSYRLDVISSAGAAGPWQLMPDTAARFSVPMTTAFDGRYSLPLATEAALTYLGWLHRFFGQDWLLALAAYNAGEGRVLKAVLSGGTRNLWALQLPTETRLYVARFIALSQLLDRAAQHDFALPSWQEGESIRVWRQPGDCSLLGWAMAKGVSMNDASRWNPAWRLPEAQGVSDCPIVYGGGKAPARSTPDKRPLLARAVSLESLHDPLLLRPARGLDMGRGGITLERMPDPLGLGQTRPLLAP
ncbi:lytic transglycosylase domain-containing protein [Aeromonas sanarellii]|uniref:Lytic transglycosylase domain-containing protein n=1 Tax=Aeromonas sanarellii TaxID=633415 RepID=A0ABS4B7K5_9GAMM|nr:lytic transglycosylase domain-containing protein [Aeromonas sanarellii]